MSNTKSSSTTILIADDHNIMRKTLRQWLSSKFSNLQIYEANSGEQTIQVLEETSVDLVLMDIHLPGINGIDTTKQIKTLYPDLPVIVLTVQEDERYKVEARQVGADAYVIKRKMYADLVPLMMSLSTLGKIER